MAQFAISRQIKLRSVEQAIFKPSYNRLNFFIQPDGLSTDLSQSYLSMRLYLTSAVSGTRISAETMKSLIANNLVVSFGNGDQSYSPACLIRVARLFANKGNELLEEVNFSNVLTQTLIHQLCNDFETLESNNLLTGSSSQIGHGSSLPASLSAFINNPTEVHIYLRDLFGICRHSNFELMATDGLNLTIELEDKQSLFKISSLGDFQVIGQPDLGGAATATTILPKTFLGSANTGFQQNANNMGSSPMPLVQYSAPSSGLFVDANANTLIQCPKEGYVFPASRYFLQPPTGTAMASLQTNQFYTAAQMTALGFVAGAYLKLKFSILSTFTGAANIAPKYFEMMAGISSIVATGATYAVINLTAGSSYYIDSVAGLTTNSSVYFEQAEVLQPSEVVSFITGTSATTIQTNLATNTLAVSQTQMSALQALGLIDDAFAPTACAFDIGVQMTTSGLVSATTGIHIFPDQIQNETSPNVRRVYSNQLTKLNAGGQKCRITGVTLFSGSPNTYLLSFTSWGCESNTSIQAANIYPTLTGYGIAPATLAQMYIWNVENYNNAPAGLANPSQVPALLNNLSYEIDKFELVLIQQTIDPKNRMPSPFIYSTWKLETATIETSQATWARQFILEENVYNCFLLTPEWNDYSPSASIIPGSGVDGSLISSKRGVSYYRYSVNQVNQTNRDIYLSNFRSQYPSSLYLDRLNDTFSNSDYILRSPVGIKGVAEASRPVTCLPLKIYHAVSEQAYVMGHPGGATVQINLFADTASGGSIIPGNVFFFKQVLKQLM